MSYVPNCFYERKDLRSGRLLDTYNIRFGHVENSLEPCEVKVLLKNFVSCSLDEFLLKKTSGKTLTCTSLNVVIVLFQKCAVCQKVHVKSM